MSTNTTSHAQAIYDFIGSYWKERGYAPTQEEIAAGVGLSYMTTRSYLLDLQSWGGVNRLEAKHHSHHSDYRAATPVAGIAIDACKGRESKNRLPISSSRFL